MTDAASSFESAQTAPPVWVVSDGRAGIQNQALGLAERIKNEHGLAHVLKQVSPKGWQRFLPVNRWPDPLSSIDRDKLGFTGTVPKLMIGCGRMAIPFLIWAKAHGVKTIYLQDPRHDTQLFDLVIAPQHDQLSGANVVTPLGSVHRITQSRLDDAADQWEDRLADLPSPRLAVLIGGDNKYYKMDTPFAVQLADRLATLAARHKAGLMITVSRRTPDIARSVLEQRLKPLTDCYFWNGDGDNPYFAFLATADFIAVTGETVNMASEAAFTGKPVYRIDLPAKRRMGGMLPPKQSNKFGRFHAALEAYGAARPLEDRLEAWTYPPLDWADEVMPAVSALITKS